MNEHSGLTNIERWKTTTAYECPDCGALHASFDGECPLECGAELVEVDAVAEHRLTGAVYLVARLNDALQAVDVEYIGSPFEEDEVRPLLAALGGQ